MVPIDVGFLNVHVFQVQGGGEPCASWELGAYWRHWSTNCEDIHYHWPYNFRWLVYISASQIQHTVRYQNCRCSTEFINWFIVVSCLFPSMRTFICWKAQIFALKYQELQYKFIVINAYLSKALRLEEACVTKQDKLFVVGFRFMCSRKIVLWSRSKSLDLCTGGLGFKASPNLLLK
jgi:hypothetical protein